MDCGPAINYSLKYVYSNSTKSKTKLIQPNNQFFFYFSETYMSITIPVTSGSNASVCRHSHAEFAFLNPWMSLESVVCFQADPRPEESCRMWCV